MLQLSQLPHMARQTPDTANAAKAQSLQAASRQFEAAILTDLLRAAGAGQATSAFGGGIGEKQFASFLLEAQAERIAQRGGIGLAEMILRSLMVQSTEAEVADDLS